MSFVCFLLWVRGTVSFRVEGKFAERFLNLLSRSGIPVEQIQVAAQFSYSPEQDTFTVQGIRAV